MNQAGISSLNTYSEWRLSSRFTIQTSASCRFQRAPAEQVKATGEKPCITRDVSGGIEDYAGIFLFDFTVVVLLTCLLGFQCLLVSRNYTTYEWMNRRRLVYLRGGQNPFDRGSLLGNWSPQIRHLGEIRTHEDVLGVSTPPPLG